MHACMPVSDRPPPATAPRGGDAAPSHGDSSVPIAPWLRACSATSSAAAPHTPGIQDMDVCVYMLPAGEEHRGHGVGGGGEEEGALGG